MLTSDQEQSAEDKWNSLRNTIYSSAVLTYGKKERKNANWFEASIIKIEPIINAKRRALINYKPDSNQQNHQALKVARSKALHTARCCAYDYWLHLSNNIQQASDIDNIRGMWASS